MIEGLDDEDRVIVHPSDQIDDGVTVESRGKTRGITKPSASVACSAGRIGASRIIESAVQPLAAGHQTRANPRRIHYEKMRGPLT